MVSADDFLNGSGGDFSGVDWRQLIQSIGGGLLLAVFQGLITTSLRIGQSIEGLIVGATTWLGHVVGGIVEVPVWWLADSAMGAEELAGQVGLGGLFVGLVIILLIIWIVVWGVRQVG